MSPARASRASRSSAAVVAGAMFFVLVGAAVPARAAPSGQILRVHELARCSANPCASGDPVVREGATIGGEIQIHLRAQSDTLLEWVRLEAQHEGGAWMCVQRYAPTAFSMQTSYDWNTTSWPEVTAEWGCDEESDHMHGEPTSNGGYRVRVLVRDRTGLEQASPTFSLRIHNAPRAPGWQAPPARGSLGGKPVVELAWYENLEPDRVEYHLVRVAPDRSRRTVVIDAVGPARSGCRLLEGVIRCTDTDFRATGSGGRYRYVLVAHRIAGRGGSRCVIDRSLRCVASQPSEARNVTLPGRYVTPSTTRARPTVVPSVSVEATPTTPSVEPSGPASHAPGLAVGSGATNDGRGGRLPWMILAAMLLALAISAHVRGVQKAARAPEPDEQPDRDARRGRSATDG